jgi:predicted AlkP superfamily phosphohydrolase/phosphomutase
LQAAVPGPVNLAVFSDHGAGPAYKAVFINTWLESLGLLRYASPRQRGNGNGRGLGLAALKALHYGTKNVVPPAGLEWLKRTFPSLRQRVKSRLVFSEIDWARTRVYAFGRESTNLFINLKGRFPQGTVNPGEEYEDLRNQVIRQLLALRDPDTGRPAVEQVFKREEVYHGECVDSAPDLLVTWRDHQYTSWPGYADRGRSIFESSLNHSDYSDWSRLQKGGNHRPNGVLILKGRAIKENFALSGAQIVDLAPTFLHWMGAPVPLDMDGKLLSEAFVPSYLAAHPPQYTTATKGSTPPAAPYTDDEAAIVEERLRTLGYVE